MASISRAARAAAGNDGKDGAQVPAVAYLVSSAPGPNDVTVEHLLEDPPAFRVGQDVVRPQVRRVERGLYEVEVEGQKHRVAVEGRSVSIDGQTVDLTVRKAPPSLGGRGAAGRAASGRIEVKPPMPGKVVDVRVAQGDSVSKGDVLVVLEAMKMQNEIMAPADGVVAELGVKPGENIDAKRVLVVLGPPKEATA